MDFMRVAFVLSGKHPLHHTHELSQLEFSAAGTATSCHSQAALYIHVFIVHYIFFMHDQYSEVLTLILVTTGLLFVFFSLTMFFVLFYQRKKLLHKEQLKFLKEQYEKEILKTQLEIQEQTFKTVSEEIHDNIGQVLSLVKLHMGTMDLRNPMQLKQKIDDSKDMLGTAIRDLRDLSKGLNSDFIAEMGIELAIKHEMKMLNKTGLYKTSFNTTGASIRLDNKSELIIFRMVQEVLNNIVKHAEATAIAVCLCYEQHSIKIAIEDDGKGMRLPDKNRLQKEEGAGIKNMQHRAELIGADFKIESDIGIGTKVLIRTANYKLYPEVI